MGIMLPPFYMPIVRPPAEVSDPYLQGATFTVTLGSLIENDFDIGLKNYPIFDENYREGLNNKIIDHFWFREIGLETPQLFKRFLNRRMNEIMPFYNQLYKTELDANDAFMNIDVTSKRDGNTISETASNTTNTESSNTSNSTTGETDTKSSSRALVSQTPQMQLSGHDDYASNITDSKSDGVSTSKSNSVTGVNGRGNSSSVSNGKTTDDYITRVTGLQGITKAAAILQLRETFLNVDMLVINDLNDLFMDVYNDYANFL